MDEFIFDLQRFDDETESDTHWTDTSGVWTYKDDSDNTIVTLTNSATSTDGFNITGDPTATASIKSSSSSRTKTTTPRLTRRKQLQAPR